MDINMILSYVGNIAENLESMIQVIEKESVLSEGAVYVDNGQNVNFISVGRTNDFLEKLGANSASAMLGKTEYILIYDTSKVVVIDGEAYLPSGYVVMKLQDGLVPLVEDDAAAVISELNSRMATLVLGKYRIQAYQLE